MWLIAMLGLAAVAADTGPSTAGPLAKRRAARHHAWGRFQPGSWSLVRTVTDTLDEKGATTAQTIAETRTTIDEVTEAGVTLEVHKTVEVAGKKLEAPPQKVVHALAPEDMAADTVDDLGTENVVVDGRTYACRVERITARSAGRTVLIRTWINEDVAPFLLRREMTVSDTATGAKLEEESLEVIKLGTPCKVLDETRLAAEVRLVARSPKGRTVTQAWQSLDVPGGIVGQNSEEFDTQDHLLRRSRLELIDYAVK